MFIIGIIILYNFKVDPKLFVALPFSWAMVHLYFLRRRINIAYEFLHLRSWKKFIEKVERVIQNEFKSSESFQFYTNYRKLYFSNLQYQKILTSSLVIVNPINFSKSIFSLKIFQVS